MAVDPKNRHFGPDAKATAQGVGRCAARVYIVGLGMPSLRPRQTQEVGESIARAVCFGSDLVGGNNQDRVDIQHQSTLTAEGKDTWISGYYLMPTDAGMRNEFAFWESNNTSQNVMDFWIEPKAGGGTTIGFGVGALASTR